MTMLPLKQDRRIEITIQPWAIAASSGAKLSEPIHGIWFTGWSALYSSAMAVEGLLGAGLGDIPKSIIELAIYDAGRYVDALAVSTCPNPNLDYFGELRKRYVTLRAAISLGHTQVGLSPVVRKVLGDFEIEFDTQVRPGHLLAEMLREMQDLEPAVMSKGCLGIASDHRAQVMVKGASDPYRAMPARTWYTPHEGELGNVRGVSTPGYNRSKGYLRDRGRRSGLRTAPWGRRRGG